MATSGWQTEKFIKQCMTTYSYYGNVNIKSITHSGTNLRVTGTVALCSRGTSGYRYNWQNIIYANVAGKGNLTVRPVGYVYVGTDTYADFDVTISGVAATATTYDLSVNFNSYNLNVTLSWPLSFSASGTTPSGLTATLNSVADTSASIAVNLTSYGTPDSSADRYIEAAVLGQNSYGASYRYDTAKAVKTATISVGNSSRANPADFTIKGNTTYWYGAYATNTVMSTSVVSGSFTTKPAYISNVTVTDNGHGQMSFVVVHDPEGTAATVTTKYSLDGGDWVDTTDAFTLSLTGSHTVSVKRVSNAGETPVVTVSVVPFTTVSLYGSVNNKSKKVQKLYGSVDNKSKEIKKLYASVNGKSKLIYTA